MELSYLVNLAILWCLALLALVQSINARGIIRTSVSWIVSIVIIAVAVVFTYFHVVKYEELSKILPSVLKNETSVEIKKVSPAAPAKTVSAYIASAQKLMAVAENEVRLMEDFKEFPANISAETQEEEERKALSLRNQTAQTNQNAVGLFHPRSVSEVHQELVQATENLRLAGYSLHAYTGLDNAEERKIQRTQYLNQLESAKKYLSRFKKNLEQLNP
ncbi:MAG: hypothetical protein LBR60_01585 [Fibrobacter sp.]|jgi:HSP90 family molecular chaperone|nr:hypothetical protein [Fibrobacter sp.]